MFALQMRANDRSMSPFMAPYAQNVSSSDWKPECYISNFHNGIEIDPIPPTFSRAHFCERSEHEHSKVWFEILLDKHDCSFLSQSLEPIIKKVDTYDNSVGGAWVSVTLSSWIYPRLAPVIEGKPSDASRLDPKFQSISLDIEPHKHLTRRCTLLTETKPVRGKRTDLYGTDKTTSHPILGIGTMGVRRA